MKLSNSYLISSHILIRIITSGHSISIDWDIYIDVSDSTGMVTFMATSKVDNF